jgi:hypothetical protein
MKYQMMLNKKIILSFSLLLASFTCFAQTGSADTSFAKECKQCCEFLLQNKEAYLPHEMLAPLSPLSLRQLKHFVFNQFLSSQRKDTALLSPPHKYNAGLIDAFINAEEIKLTDKDRYFNMLNGCWQMGTATITDGYNSRFVFLESDKSFVFYNSPAGVKQKEYSKSGFFFIQDSCCIELHLLSQWTIIKGKKKAKDVDWYETVKVSTIRKIEFDNAVHYILKLGKDIYWRYSNNPEECNID